MVPLGGVRVPVPPFVQQIRRKVGSDLLLLPGVAAVVFDGRGRVLLGRRADNGRWGVIGGIVEPGEHPADCCVREVLEETGVHCVVDRVVGVYATAAVRYPNGHRAQYVVTSFACRATGGEPRVGDDESLDVQYFDVADLPADMPPDHRRRVDDAVAGLTGAVFDGGRR